MLFLPMLLKLIELCELNVRCNEHNENRNNLHLSPIHMNIQKYVWLCAELNSWLM